MQVDTQQLLALCEANQTQLHLSQAIQSRGALLAVDAQGQIAYASANSVQFIAREASDLLGQPISLLPGLCEAVAELPAGEGECVQRLLPFDIDSSPVHVRLIRTAQYVLIELEPELQRAGQYRALRPVIHFPRNDLELVRHHQDYLDYLRELSGFDRVMIYRFAEDWSGEVIAASSDAGFGDYLGLRFPASDIPPLMRELYLLNPYRLITDAQAPSVGLLGLTPERLDLSRSDLRSVAPIHVSYLFNMGVAASFSIPIIVNRQLWGLTSCHHRQPLLLDPSLRQLCVELARNHTVGLAYYLSNLHLQRIDGIERRIERLIDGLYSGDDLVLNLGEVGAGWVDIMRSNGLVMVQSGRAYTYGDTPTAEGVALIDAWFMSLQEFQFSCYQLSELFPEENSCFPFNSGFYAIKLLSRGSGWVRFYWFRHAVVNEVRWAGNPNEPVMLDPDTAELSPRRSFESWVEKKMGQSNPWSSDDQMVAAKFRQTLQLWLG